MDDKVRCKKILVLLVAMITGYLRKYVFNAKKKKKKWLWHVESSPQALVLNAPEVPNVPLTPGSSYGLAEASGHWQSSLP